MPQVDLEDEAQAQQLQADVAAAESQLRDLQTSCSQLQARKAAVQAQLDEVGGAALKEQRAGVTRLQQVRPNSLSDVFELCAVSAMTCPVQETASSESEATKKAVLADSSRKAAVKLRKDLARGEEQLQKVGQQMDVQSQALKVTNATLCSPRGCRGLAS